MLKPNVPNEKKRYYNGNGTKDWNDFVAGLKKRKQPIVPAYGFRSKHIQYCVDSNDDYHIFAIDDGEYKYSVWYYHWSYGMWIQYME